MLELYNGSLNVNQILQKWYNEEKNNNYGAFVPFIGIVRAEDNIEALSFDIYEPILIEWVENWQKRVAKDNIKLKMAHSIGDVSVHTTSYISAVFSPKRKVALSMIEEFVEDFKASAPIWKYDLINGKRIYAKDRSTAIKGSGILK